MDALKSELARRRREKEEEFEGQKYVRRGEVVKKRLMRLRDQEKKELEEKVTCDSLTSLSCTEVLGCPVVVV